MTALPPPEQPAAISPACVPVLSQTDADLARERIAAAIPSTKFTSAWPACLPGFVALRLEDGSVAYTDKFGRYLVLGLVFDISSGQALDRQLDGLKE